MRWTHVVRIGLGAMLLLALKPQDSPVGTDATSLTAAQILERMAKVYATCKSYRDAGVVQLTIWSAEQSNPTVRSSKPFRTAFVRPGRFRFEYDEQKWDGVSRYIVWQDGAEVRTWWDVKPGVESPSSLGMALAGATGVSSGSAHTIPRLLLPLQVAGACLKDIASATRLSDACLDDAACFVVQGVRGVDVKSDITAWIDQSTFLVRRLDHSMSSDDIRSATTTTYKPEIDIEIGNGELAFDPPTK